SFGSGRPPPLPAVLGARPPSGRRGASPADARGHALRGGQLILLLARAANGGVMGTPSGSKNQTVFDDRLERRARDDFDGGAYWGPGVEGADSSAYIRKTVELKAAKRLEAEEINEFYEGRNEVRIEQKINRFEQLKPKAAAVGPSAANHIKKVPSFIRTKSKESNAADEEAPAKKARTAEAKAPGAAALGGLLSYGSDDSDEEEDDE
ncbi:unnamed protein product, partial [Prorocentrum cordatum]